MIKDVLVKFYNDINTLDDNKLTLVTYEDGILVYRQLSKIIMLPNIELLYLPKRKFKYGLLTQYQLSQLRSELFKLIQESSLDNQNALVSPKELGFVVYELVDGLKGPQITYECKFVGISSKSLTKSLLRFSNSESRLLLKLLKKIKK